MMIARPTIQCAKIKRGTPSRTRARLGQNIGRDDRLFAVRAGCCGVGWLLGEGLGTSGTVAFWGMPHPGQDVACSLICLLHSAQDTSAIMVSFVWAGVGSLLGVSRWSHPDAFMGGCLRALRRSEEMWSEGHAILARLAP